MSEQAGDQQAEPTGKRGDAAWKAERERVAARNDSARKAGRQQRQADELTAARRRRAADLREAAELSRRVP
jgi:hypothetical protein